MAFLTDTYVEACDVADIGRVGWQGDPRRSDAFLVRPLDSARFGQKSATAYTPTAMQQLLFQQVFEQVQRSLMRDRGTCMAR